MLSDYLSILYSDHVYCFLIVFGIIFILFQIKSNPHRHTCPPGGGGGKDKSKLIKTRWVADAILDWVRKTPTIGQTALYGKLFEKYKINVQYMKIVYAK